MFRVSLPVQGGRYAAADPARCCLRPPSAGVRLAPVPRGGRTRKAGRPRSRRRGRSTVSSPDGQPPGRRADQHRQANGRHWAGSSPTSWSRRWSPHRQDRRLSGRQGIPGTAIRANRPSPSDDELAIGCRSTRMADPPHPGNLIGARQPTGRPPRSPLLAGQDSKDHLPALLPGINGKRPPSVVFDDRSLMLSMQAGAGNGSQPQTTSMIDRKSIKCGFESRLGHSPGCQPDPPCVISR